MPQFRIMKGGAAYNLTADTQEEAVLRVEQAHQDRMASDEADMDAINGPQVQRTEEDKPERSVIDAFKGNLDVLYTMGSEMAAGAVGGILGTVEGGVELVGNKVFGDGSLGYGTAEGAQYLADTIQRRGDSLRRELTTDAGREQMQAVGEFLEPLQDPKYAAVSAAIPTAPIGRIPGAVSAAAVRTGGQMIGQGVIETAEKAIKMLPGRGEDAPDTGVGAAEADAVQAMIVSAREFGFEGDSGPTVGQATRDPEQLRFENEAAKDPEGRPIEERRQNQQQRLGQVFDEMEEDANQGVVFGDDDDQGRAVQAALEARKEERRIERNRLYKVAQEAGEMDEEIEIPRLLPTFLQLQQLEDLVPASGVVMKMARKQGLIGPDGTPQRVSVQEIENFREFVNKAYNYADPRERMERGKVIAALDAALDGSVSGEKYAEARRYASSYRDEFFNSPMASRMTSNKKNANVPAVDPGKVYDTIQRGSIQEIKQLEKTLSATEEGRAVWGSVQGRMIEHLRQKAFGTQQDGARNPLATPSTLIKEVQKLSKSGKLEAVLGKAGAQKMEDLSQLVSDLMTSPPGTQNHSNSLMALRQWARTAPIELGKLVPLLEQSIKQAQSMNKSRKVNNALDATGLLGSIK